MPVLLDIKNLEVEFKTEEGFVKAIQGISFSIDKAETVAVVGESGSGKTTLAKLLLHFLLCS